MQSPVVHPSEFRHTRRTLVAVALVVVCCTVFFGWKAARKGDATRSDVVFADDVHFPPPGQRFGLTEAELQRLPEDVRRAVELIESSSYLELSAPWWTETVYRLDGSMMEVTEYINRSASAPAHIVVDSQFAYVEAFGNDLDPTEVRFRLPTNQLTVSSLGPHWSWQDAAELLRNPSSHLVLDVIPSATDTTLKFPYGAVRVALNGARLPGTVPAARPEWTSGPDTVMPDERAAARELQEFLTTAEHELEVLWHESTNDVMASKWGGAPYFPAGLDPLPAGTTIGVQINLAELPLGTPPIGSLELLPRSAMLQVFETPEARRYVRLVPEPRIAKHKPELATTHTQADALSTVPRLRFNAIATYETIIRSEGHRPVATQFRDESPDSELAALLRTIGPKEVDSYRLSGRHPDQAVPGLYLSYYASNGYMEVDVSQEQVNQLIEGMPTGKGLWVNP
jgi:hypothetical protein